MDPFETGQIGRGGIPPASSGEEEQQTGGPTEWDAVITGFAATSGHLTDVAVEQDEALENWAAEEDVGLLEDREEAAIRINAVAEEAILDLESLSLTSLPRLPSEIVVIEVPFNRLANLPNELPASLRRLNVSGNQLSHLPVLPIGLRGLDVNYNRLESLPAVLPAGLQFLSANYNRLPNLPEDLPSSLRFLHVGHNQLTNLPQVLPASLEFLDVSQNQLTDLPQVFPTSLEFLDVSQNHLTGMPEDLLTRLSTDATIVLTDNPLAAQVLTNLDTVLNAEGYAGPTVHLSRDDESLLSETDDEKDDPLTEMVAKWLESNPQEGDREVLSAWHDFVEEPGAQEYGLFLGKLFDSVNFNNEAFRQSVAYDLREAAKHPQLRAQYFQLALDANQSCEDRRTLTWNGMQTARLMAEVENGRYDDKARLGDLIDLGRVMFRMDTLEAIARGKAHSLGSAHEAEDIDAIEVFLAYQNKLRERLGLQHVAPEMRFFEVSGVTDSDVDSAEISVRNREAAEFADYLAMDWQPWDDVVRRIAPEDHATTQERLIGAMGTEFESRLEQQLADQGLIGAEADLIEDAKRTLGPAVRNEIAREIKGALRDKMLNEIGLTL
ncbi:NEL-type E3 ubiquitin ligase domain-containing protein [Bradyrhizobium sp. SBR1B]|uniref:NEL-type E3 ubiquitin ligase domain-containing protein n=1 Tax=Bradyrhizobium sp. SBR1B TaxID=2663836 RepID=UPI0016066D1E|nr:NEL-type E3 ubiquitin ligase domain-containing protein [Bradyrhizobium sp. SBR1B]MBB4380265.1 hypothetical protein [Bradyrhizobium sp. SBR1B]